MGNSATSGGGFSISPGGAWWGGNLILKNSLVINNSATYGGAICFPDWGSSDGAYANVINSTFYNNTADYGNWIYTNSSNNYYKNSISAINSIIWNGDPEIVDISGDLDSNITYCDISGGILTNFYSDPLFEDPTNNNFQLSWSNYPVLDTTKSPCIDSGNPDLDNDGITWETDLDDQDPDGTRMDMGAYYFDQSEIDTIAPSSPFNLTATPGTQQVTLTWSPNTESDIYMYKIYRFSMPPTALIDSVFHPDTTYIDTGLTNGLTYHYTITAKDSSGNESTSTEIVSATPTDGPIPYNNFLWSARFGGIVGDVVDLHNYIGVIEGASYTWDEYDEPEPPHAPSNYISLYFTTINPSSVLAYPIDWGTADHSWLIIDTDLDRDQPFILELELALTSLYSVNVFSYEYITPSSGNFYHLVWGKDSTVVSIEFPVIPGSISLKFNDLIGNEIYFESPPPDSTIYRLGGETLYVTFSQSDDYHLFYYSYLNEEWDYIGNQSQLQYSWGDTPLDDFGYIRMINLSDGHYVSAISGDVVFFSNHTALNEGWNFLSIPHSGGDGFLDDMIWQYTTPDNYYLYTYINGEGWIATDQINHNNGYAISLTSNYSVGYIDSSYNNMDLSLDIGSGWNIIGSPFKFDKNLHDSRVVHLSNPNDTITFDLAVTNEWLIGTVYDYGSNSNYSTTDTLKPWKSYWLASLSDSLEFIYPSTELTQARSIEELWQVTFNADPGQGITSSITLGGSPSATDLFDPGFDYPKPPPFPENGYLNTFFYHEDWIDQFSGRFMSDIRSDSPDQTWVIDAVNDTIQSIAFTWDNGSIPEDQYLYLQTDNELIDMKKESGIVLTGLDIFPITIIGSSEELSLTDVLNLPKTYSLHQNYPNPFNPITTLRYDLPERSDVVLTVYNILGKQVRILAQSIEDPGFKSVVWDSRNNLGEPVSAGVYLYQIRAGDFVQTKKMILLK